MGKSPHSVNITPQEIPPELQDPRFLDAWRDWHEYRREQRWKPWRPMTVRRKLRELAEAGVDSAVEAIERSIGNGWQGLFPKPPKRRVVSERRAIQAAELRSILEWTTNEPRHGPTPSG